MLKVSIYNMLIAINQGIWIVGNSMVIIQHSTRMLDRYMTCIMMIIGQMMGKAHL